MIRDALFLYCVGAGLSVFFDLSDYFNGIYCDFYLTTMSFLLTIRIAVIIIKHIIQIDFIGYGAKNMSITKIAAITGASVSTVARVLREPEHKCHSMELKEKILQTAREIGYVPNEAARALKNGDTPRKIFHINILLTRVNSDETDPFYSEMLRLVEIEVRKSGGLIENIWRHAVFSSEKKADFSEIEKLAGRMFHTLEQKHDGLILIGKCS